MTKLAVLQLVPGKRRMSPEELRIFLELSDLTGFREFEQDFKKFFPKIIKF